MLININKITKDKKRERERKRNRYAECHWAID